MYAYAVQGCSSNDNNNPVNNAVTASAKTNVKTGDQPLMLHSIVVLEVIQVDNYTYLRVKEGEKELWIAAPTIDTKVGETLYYENGMLMTDFESKELKRKFDAILFVDKISKDRSFMEAAKDSPLVMPPGHPNAENKTADVPNMGSPKETVQQDIKIEPSKNGKSIADILKNPKLYEGKKVIVKGKVTKYTGGVMGKNWVHIQDGTKYNGKFEIVITTTAELKEGDNAEFEGPITLNKDLGFGYFFEVLMEDAKLVE